MICNGSELRQGQHDAWGWEWEIEGSPENSVAIQDTVSCFGPPYMSSDKRSPLFLQRLANRSPLHIHVKQAKL